VEPWHYDRWAAIKATPTPEGNAAITRYGSDGPEAFALFVANPI
jgi:hypothetical protein